MAVHGKKPFISPLGRERAGGIMRKTLGMYFILIVCAMPAFGCGRFMAEENTKAEIPVEVETVQESTVPEEAPELETGNVGEPLSQAEIQTEPETPESEESTEMQGSNMQTLQTDRELKKTETPEQEWQIETKREPEKTETQPEIYKLVPEEAKPEPETEKAETVLYNPQTVAELAVGNIKANGKIYIPDALNQMLVAGEISQEDYNVCYPTDGAGYLEYYVAADMNEARDISGTVQFNSEADIAANIAGMYAALPQQYFYIEYHGTVIYDDKECHVFYCYRA